MSGEKIIREDGQEVIVVSQKTTTFTEHSEHTGHQISTVKINIGELEISVTQHSKDGVLSKTSPAINIHDLGNSEITIHGKVTKKQRTTPTRSISPSHTWTTINSKVE